ncbi:MAG: hypothetical protein DIU52_013700 [bacterium]|jgi:hypothetical protein
MDLAQQPPKDGRRAILHLDVERLRGSARSTATRPRLIVMA